MCVVHTYKRHVAASALLPIMLPPPASATLFPLCVSVREWMWSKIGGKQVENEMTAGKRDNSGWQLAKAAAQNERQETKRGLKLLSSAAWTTLSFLLLFEGTRAKSWQTIAAPCCWSTYGRSAGLEQWKPWCEQSEKAIGILHPFAESKRRNYWSKNNVTKSRNTDSTFKQSKTHCTMLILF